MKFLTLKFQITKSKNDFHYILQDFTAYLLLLNCCHLKLSYKINLKSAIYLSPQKNA